MKNTATAFLGSLFIFCASLLTTHGAEPSKVQHIVKWGDVIDPDGDCEFFTTNGTLKIVIPGSDHALATERGKTNAPRVLQEIKGDFLVTVKVSGEFATNTSSTVSSRRAFQGAGLLLWQDAGNYIRLERAQLVVGEKTMSYASFELRRHGRFAIQGNAAGYPLKGTETGLQLERRGDKVSAFMSEDGVNWNLLKTITVDWTETVHVGVVAGHNTSTPLTAAFQDFKVKPLPAASTPP